ncbi:glycosyltransferase [uncultured Methylobacterium sp.]|uniref:glycosyltransferase n=1 Tax=uncultured Methylobacterium sp. TaxID=157278 RepID=UPI0035CAA6F5
MPLNVTPHDVIRWLRRWIGGAKRAMPIQGDYRMKWYFATNEAGSEGVAGLHARLMVLSALQNTRLRPHLITTGFRNDFTTWMEARGVTIIDAIQPLSDAIHQAAETGGYDTKYLGHWLRCEIPLIESEDNFVLYTDSDVIFLDGFKVPNVAPEYFAAAPEFRIDDRSYVNTGVMIINVHNMRKISSEFFQFARHEISNLKGEVYHDQFAYNRYFAGRWTPLDPSYNWKPYWGDPSTANILHFHGAKLNAISMLYEQELPFHEVYWQQIGSLVASFPEGYLQGVEATLQSADGAELSERSWIEGIVRHLRSGPPRIPAGIINIDFLKFQPFGT